MRLSTLDLAVLIFYFVAMIGVGWCWWHSNLWSLPKILIEAQRLPWFHPKRNNPWSTAHFELSAPNTLDCSGFKFTLLPGNVDFKATSHSQSLDASVRPCLRQRRQQMNLAVMRLQQHLRNPGGSSKIAVDLEGWMRVKQIGIHTAPAVIPDVFHIDRRQCSLQQQIGMIAVQ